MGDEEVSLANIKDTGRPFDAEEKEDKKRASNFRAKLSKADEDIKRQQEKDQKASLTRARLKGEKEGKQVAKAGLSKSNTTPAESDKIMRHLKRAAETAVVTMKDINVEPPSAKVLSSLSPKSDSNGQEQSSESGSNGQEQSSEYDIEIAKAKKEKKNEAKNKQTDKVLAKADRINKKKSSEADRKIDKAEKAEAKKEKKQKVDSEARHRRESAEFYRKQKRSKVPQVGAGQVRHPENLED